MVNKKSSWVKPFFSSCLLLGFASLLSAAEEATQVDAQTATEEESQASGYRFPQFLHCPSETVAPVRYIAPTAKSGKVEVLSDKGVRQGASAFLSGNILVSQDGQQLSADKLTADSDSQSYSAEGNLLLTNQNFVVGADSLHYQADSQNTEIENTRFHLYSNNGNGTAARIQVNQQQILTLEDAEFSTCPQNQRSWAFESDKIIIDRENGWGEAYGSVVRIADVPVFYLPYITFPIDDRRKSGLLPPSLANSSRNGRDISLPYYLNLAENYDLTLTPRYLSARGAMLGSEFRYLTQNHQGSFDFEYLPNDKKFDSSSINPSKKKRWLYDFNHQSNFTEFWSASIHSKKVSDDSYFQDFGGSLDNSNQDILSQNYALQYLDEDWFFKTQYQDWQLLNSPSERYTISPRVELNRYFSSDKHGFNGSVQTQLTRFENTNEQANRYHIEPSIGWSYESLYSFVRPQLSYAYTEYQQTDVNNNKQTFSRGLPRVSLDSGLFFERNLNFDQSNYTQTLEPRLFYLYTPYKEQTGIGLYDTNQPTFNFTQLFSRNRFSGIDRIGDANQFSTSLSSRIIDDNGVERLAVTVGRTFYLEDRKVQLIDNAAIQQADQSGLLAQINWRWTDAIEIKSAIEWDDQTRDTQQGLFSVHYEPKPNHILNLGHRYRQRSDETQEEAEFAFAWPIKDNWRLMGRYNRDLSQNRTIEAFVGLEYESCCWAVRLVSRRYLNIQLDNQGSAIIGQGDQHNSGIFLQFVLKGIGSLRGSTTQFLEDSLYGYQDVLGK